MKRISMLLFLFVNVWVLIACSGKSEKEQDNKGDVSIENVDKGCVLPDDAFEAEVSYANWTDDKDIYIKALNGNKMSEAVPYFPIYKFDTLVELEEFKEEFGDVLTMDGDYNDVPSLNSVTAKYDVKFFEENSVLLVYVEESSGSPRYGVNSVYCDGKSVCINVEKIYNPEVQTDDMAGWFVTVAIPDSMIKNCTEFDARYYSQR